MDWQPGEYCEQTAGWDMGYCERLLAGYCEQAALPVGYYGHAASGVL